MYHHVKKLMYTVRVGVPDPQFGNMLLEQFGGANGELAAAMCDAIAAAKTILQITPDQQRRKPKVGREISTVEK